MNERGPLKIIVIDDPYTAEHLSEASRDAMRLAVEAIRDRFGPEKLVMLREQRADLVEVLARMGDPLSLAGVPSEMLIGRYSHSPTRYSHVVDELVGVPDSVWDPLTGFRDRMLKLACVLAVGRRWR